MTLLTRRVVVRPPRKEFFFLYFFSPDHYKFRKLSNLFLALSAPLR